MGSMCFASYFKIIFGLFGYVKYTSRLNGFFSLITCPSDRFQPIPFLLSLQSPRTDLYSNQSQSHPQSHPQSQSQSHPQSHPQSQSQSEDSHQIHFINPS
ncbi:hypothetical protein O181_062267 [Austropuccinia psidii MF-1]|uniref:Uncharacterized protein n=1 Tax=Austropuccinia psidii MF-1 TaxID=1389203 RepID=A0A9Q3I078_9BASI|nr:hypothetical protein [Austropuccinia psidii MF-1]